MTEISKFIRWADQERKYRGLLCHFYIEKSEQQFYSTSDYAYFNIINDSRNWIVKGTPKHGIKSQRGKTSPVPCLNCFEVNKKFYDALKRLHSERNQRFEFGLILNKRKLQSKFEVIDVCTTPPIPLPPPKDCHHYDRPQFRKGVLDPFNFCDVVRVEIPQSNLLKLPMTNIPEGILTGLLVRQKDFSDIDNLWEWSKIRLFPVL